MCTMTSQSAALNRSPWVSWCPRTSVLALHLCVSVLSSLESWPLQHLQEQHFNPSMVIKEKEDVSAKDG